MLQEEEKAGASLAGRRRSAPRPPPWPPLCSVPWLRTLGSAFFWAASAPSVPGGGWLSWSRTWSSLLSLHPQGRCSGPFPGSVWLTDAARNGPGITMVGTDPRIPPKLLGWRPGPLTHLFPPFILSIETKSLSYVYSVFSIKTGASCFAFFRAPHPTSPHKKDLWSFLLHGIVNQPHVCAHPSPRLPSRSAQSAGLSSLGDPAASH